MCIDEIENTQIEALHPLAATTNSRVVTRAIDVEGHKTNYYVIISKILEFSFSGNKELLMFLMQLHKRTELSM
jgi:hypothetical protein